MIEFAAHFTPWLLMFVFILLWQQADRHKRGAWQHVADLQRLLDDSIANGKHLISIIDRYEDLHGVKRAGRTQIGTGNQSS